MKNKKILYNPFKMWGSWVGFLIGSFFAGIEIGYISFQDYFGLILFEDLSKSFTLYWFLIVGFFIGWGIHSIFRRLKK